MLDNSYERFFGTLANENRLTIIHYLAKNGDQSVNQIAEGTRIEQSLVSRHMQRLLSCQFVHIKPEGKERIYSLNNETIAPLLKLIDDHVIKYCSKVCDDCETGEKHE